MPAGPEPTILPPGATTSPGDGCSAARAQVLDRVACRTHQVVGGAPGSPRDRRPPTGAGGRQEEATEGGHRRYSELGRAGRVWGFLQRWTVGYGYRPWLAIAWLGVFWLGGALWFNWHEMVKLNSDEDPVWNAWLLSMDLLIPIVDLGQDGKWQFVGASQWISSVLIAVGWILASTAAAGAARVLKRI